VIAGMALIVFLFVAAVWRGGAFARFQGNPRA